MAIPKLGLVVEFLLGTLPRNAKKYERYMQQMGLSTDKLSKSTAKSTKQMATSYEELIKKSGKLKSAMSEMSSSRQKNLVEGLTAAFQKLGSKAAIDIGIFDKLVGSGEAIGGAFQGAKGAVSGLATAAGGAAKGGLALGTSLAVVGGALSIVGAAVGVFVGGVTTMVAVIKNSISAFQASALELRDWQLQLGGSTEAISKMIIGAEMLGVKVSSLRSGFAIFEKKLTDFELRMAVGSEESHELERALSVLDVTWKNADGTARSMNEMLPEIADAFKELGPGMTTTGLAMNLFGRSAKDMLPFLFQGAEGMKELGAIAEKTGATMTSKDVKAAEEWQKSMVTLDKSIEGVKQTIARQFMPAAQEFVKFVGSIARELKALVTIINAVGAAAITASLVLMKTGDGYAAGQAAAQAFTASVEQASGALTEQEKAEEALQTAQEKRAQDVAKARMAAAEISEDIADLEEQLDERRIAAELSFDQQWEDIQTARAREREDAETATARKRADLWLAYQRRIADIMDAYNKKRRDREEENRKKWADFEAWAALQREKLLNRHLERMEAIRERFQATADEAARRNDAVALLRAMRQKALDDRLEKTRYGHRREELEKDIALRRKKLEDAIKKQEDDDKDRLDDALARAKLAYERQLEDLAIALVRQEEDRQKGYVRQLADFNLAEQRQADARQRWFDKENDALQEKLAIQEAIIGDDYSVRETLLEESLERQSAMMDAFYTAQAAGASAISNPALLRAAGMGLPPPRVPSPRMHGRAEGGIDVVSSPTHYVAGEGGREIAAFIPLTGSVHHTFERLGMDVGGVSSATEAQMAPLMISLLQQMVKQVR